MFNSAIPRCVLCLSVAMESHGEAEIEVHLNCSHCQTQSCKRDDETRLILCLCHNEEVLAPDNVSCIGSYAHEATSSTDQSVLGEKRCVFEVMLCLFELGLFYTVKCRCRYGFKCRCRYGEM